MSIYLVKKFFFCHGILEVELSSGTNCIFCLSLSQVPCIQNFRAFAVMVKIVFFNDVDFAQKMLVIFGSPVVSDGLKLTFTLPISFFICKKCLLFKSAAYFQMQFIKANFINPDQTAPKGAV